MLKQFQNFICFLIYDLKLYWIEDIINHICTVEMEVRSMWKPSALLTSEIPEGLYCYDGGHTCPYFDTSRVAKFFYGYQSDGYCHYLRCGDYNSSTMILWDMCKCCGIKDDVDIEDELECNLEL